MFQVHSLKEEGPDLKPIGLAEWTGDKMVFKPEEYIPQGEVCGWHIEADVPPKRQPGHFFYIVGHVVYFDRLKVRHATFFARRYDPKTLSFKRVRNPDWEGHE